MDTFRLETISGRCVDGSQECCCCSLNERTSHTNKLCLSFSSLCTHTFNALPVCVSTHFFQLSCHVIKCWPVHLYIVLDIRKQITKLGRSSRHSRQQRWHCKKKPFKRCVASMRITIEFWFVANAVGVLVGRNASGAGRAFAGARVLIPLLRPLGHFLGGLNLSRRFFRLGRPLSRIKALLIVLHTVIVTAAIGTIRKARVQANKCTFRFLRTTSWWWQWTCLRQHKQQHAVFYKDNAVMSANRCRRKQTV